MNIVKKTVVLNDKDYYKKHLMIINPMLPIMMTMKEIDVLSEFMRLKGSLAEDRFSTTGRKIVMNELGLSHGSLGNHLRNLKKKGFIIDLDTKLIILGILYPATNEQLYAFKLTKK